MTKARILLIYTGGTVGMVEDQASKFLRPFDFDHLVDQIPELKKLNVDLHSIALDKPVDSSNMHPVVWVALARMIGQHYDDFDGFVLLHGSDTMSYTASALSFLLENLKKPVVLTGSQLPIGVIRTDGKENILTAIEIAATRNPDGTAVVPEVAVYFEYKLYRGNRTHKLSAENFEAFASPNYPVLASAGVHIKFDEQAIVHPNWKDELNVNQMMSDEVAILHLFPGISEAVVQSILNLDVKGVLIRTFGSGNAPTYPWFIDALRQAKLGGKVLLNVTQCHTGTVEQGRYETSQDLVNIGVVGGRDMTLESGITKMMYLFGRGLSEEEVNHYLAVSLRGELTA